MAFDVRGKTVVLTGTFSRLKRADAEAKLVALGAKIGSGVGKGTHVLFAGEKAGSKINDELLDQAIAAAREASSADLGLEEVSRRMAAVGDLAGAHRAWLAIVRGRRPNRNGPLLDACVERGQWAAVLDLLEQMPGDLNGAPQRASQVLLKAAGGEGW